MDIDVCVPWPIFCLWHERVMLPSGAMRMKAFGAKPGALATDATRCPSPTG